MIDEGENGKRNVFNHEHDKIKQFRKQAHLPIMEAALSAHQTAPGLGGPGCTRLRGTSGMICGYVQQPKASCLFLLYWNWLDPFLKK